MSKDPIERQYAALATKVEVLPTPEQFARMHGSRNLEVGGGGRMEEAVLFLKCQNGFDILDEGGAFDHDHHTAIARFRAAYYSFAVQVGSHYGRLNDASSMDDETGMPLDQLYMKLLKQISRKRFKMLLMLIEPLPDGAEREVIERYRNYLFPQKCYAEDAIIALEVAMEAIAKEEKRKAEVAAREAELNAKWLAMNVKPGGEGTCDN